MLQMTRRASLIRRLLIAGILCMPVFAGTIGINNSSFESHGAWTTPYQEGNYNTGPIPSWTHQGAGNFGSWLVGAESFNFVPDGSVTAYTNSSNLSQTLTTTLADNTTYTLTVAIGRRLDGGSRDATIQLLAGQTVLTSASMAIMDVESGGWTDLTAVYTSGASDSNAGKPLEIRLVSNGSQSNFDYVRLDGTTVPEPAAYLTSGLGLIALALRRRK